MSFRDLTTGFGEGRKARRPKDAMLPTIRATQPPEKLIGARRVSSQPNRPIVLHGRVQRVVASEYDDTHTENKSLANRSLYSTKSNDSFATRTTYSQLMEERIAHRRQRSSASMSSAVSRKSYQSLAEPRVLLEKRRTAFAQLSHETVQYGKLVADLEQLLALAGESPELAWRARIMMRSAIDCDKELAQKLNDYEKTLYTEAKVLPHHRSQRVQPPSSVAQTMVQQDHLRRAQTACLKLHRDFKRSHKALVMALSLYEKRQKAQVSSLGAVGWTEPRSGAIEEDFFDRAMRERDEEIRRMQTSMYAVRDIYKDLGSIIEGQQETISRLEEEVDEAKANTEAAWNCVSGAAAREENSFCGGPSSLLGAASPADFWQCVGVEEEKGARSSERTARTDSAVFGDPSYGCSMGLGVTESFADTNTEGSSIAKRTMSEESDGSPVAADPLRVSEDFHWLMPFETLKEDFQAVKRDLVGFGNQVMAATK